MLISPSPPSLVPSQITWYTPVPVLSLLHITSLYTASNFVCSSTHGSTELSRKASCRSPGSRGRMAGSGNAAIASACLEVMTLCSQAEALW